MSKEQAGGRINPLAPRPEQGEQGGRCHVRLNPQESRHPSRVPTNFCQQELKSNARIHIQEKK